MRLKGGKLLLDLTSYGDIYGEITAFQHSLSDEEIECIRTKGLDVKIKFAGHIIVWNLPLREYIPDDDFFKTTISVNSSDFSEFILDTDDKALVYKEL